MNHTERSALADRLEYAIKILGTPRCSVADRRMAVGILENVHWKLEPRTPTGRRIRDITAAMDRDKK